MNINKMTHEEFEALPQGWGSWHTTAPGDPGYNEALLQMLPDWTKMYAARGYALLGQISRVLCNEFNPPSKKRKAMQHLIPRMKALHLDLTVVMPLVSQLNHLRLGRDQQVLDALRILNLLCREADVVARSRWIRGVRCPVPAPFSREEDESDS